MRMGGEGCGRGLVARRTDTAKREEAAGRRIAVTVAAGGSIFGVLIPYGIVKAGVALDRILKAPSFFAGVPNLLAGGILAAGGFSLAVWTIAAQLSRGRGTPLPLMPTQRLLTDGPYAVCRNPMALGTLIAYLGVGTAAGSPCGLGVVVVLGCLLLAYVRVVEERELERRFGSAYRAYRTQVPFLFPKVSSLRRK